MILPKGESDTNKKALIYYNKVRKAKRTSWRRYCQGIADVPGSAGLMRVMAKHATNRITQTARETPSSILQVD
jgi:hypothetical protein